MIKTSRTHLGGELFSELPPTPATHFRLCYLEAVLHVMGQAAQSLGSVDSLLAEYPFLKGYQEEFAAYGLGAGGAEKTESAWRSAIIEWEECIPEHLPLGCLARAAGLDYTAVSLLFAIGLGEEDARFGLLFEAMQGLPGQRRPTVGLLNAWWRPAEDQGEVRTRLRLLQDLGLAQVVNPEAPRLEWGLQPMGLLWDALRGLQHPNPAPWLRYYPTAALKPAEQLILPAALRDTLKKLTSLVDQSGLETLVVRGPKSNGRRTLLGAVARALDRGLLEVSVPLKSDDERWRVVGSLATALHALPVVAFELAPGDTAELPRLSVSDGPLGVVLGRQGGLTGPGVETALTLNLDLPDAEARRALWAQSLGSRSAEDLAEISDRCRLTSGNIHRTATLAKTCAGLSHGFVTAAAMLEARRTLHRHTLDHLAARVSAVGDWSQLAAGPETFAELRALESRCRNRERLSELTGAALGSQLNAGVRALFSGPSGTGKTLAGRLLASVLQMDLYRLDLAAVVNKYIGETEKNLSQIFSRAEELDVILLLDEGDALLTQRTAVQTSNDRYANLETNYLLQRIESYEGILIVTTNAADRIDSAFQRRMDVVVSFRPPDVQERGAIWQLHLPATHLVGPEVLGEVVGRCALTGGQIRNAALHAAVLAIEDGGVITSTHLTAAVQREYRRAGAVCPLRQLATRA